MPDDEAAGLCKGSLNGTGSVQGKLSSSGVGGREVSAPIVISSGMVGKVGWTNLTEAMDPLRNKLGREALVPSGDGGA